MGAASEPASQSAPVRRAPWSGRHPAAHSTSAADKLVDATIACIRQHGVERTSISAIAAIAGVSRPTVYAHFDTREALILAALEKADAAIAGQVAAAARRRSTTAADFVVEALVAGRREFRAESALNPVNWLLAESQAAGDALSERALGIARTILAPIVAYDPRLEAHIDEISETMIRWLLSLLMFDSVRTSTEAKLRSYLRRAVLPALNIPSDRDDSEKQADRGTDRRGGAPGGSASAWPA